MDHRFTDGNDTIIATNDTGYELGDRVFAGDGDDHISLGSGVIYVSESGNDTIIGQIDSGLAFWFDHGPSDINLVSGVVRDAHGGIDNVSGVTGLHLSSFGAKVVGSHLNEIVFYSGGDSDINLGGGELDKLIMTQWTYDQYELRTENESLYLTGEGNNLILRGVEQIEFKDRIVNTAVLDSTLYSTFKSDVWSFIETEIAPAYNYAGELTESQLVTHYAGQELVLDLDGDGDLDFFASISKGYASGIDTRTHFVVLENQDGKLVYNQEMSELTPFISSSRRMEVLNLSGYGDVIVSVAHDTTAEGETRFDIPWRLGDIAIIGTQPLKDVTEQVIPLGQLPYVSQTGRNTAVNAHSLAIGDVNGDGLEDIVVGDYSGPFVLLQTSFGNFTFEQSEFFKSLDVDWFEPTFSDATDAFLLDLYMADFNGDGFDDLIAGWGHAKVLSRIFFNDGSGDFSLQASTTLPVAVYGSDNSLHMETYAEDFDQDGDLDLVILQVRNEPWYSGNYLQFLVNDGSGNFTDETLQRFGDPIDQSDTFGSRLMSTDNWQIMDVNGDGFIDVLGHDLSTQQTPFVWLNLGNGAFTRLEIPADPITNRPLQWADFDQNGTLEFISFNSSWADETGTAVTYELSVYELAATAFNSQSHWLEQSAGDDELRATSQNDLIDGMEGTDTVLFPYASTDTILQFNTDGTLLLIDRNGNGGTDSLRNVELLRFSDRTLDMSNFSSAVQLSQVQLRQLAELYVAYFNRAPDSEGLLYWADKLADGKTLDQIAEYFFDQHETRSIYADPSDTDTFINSVYKNVLGRTPDAGGFTYWKEQLENSAFTEDAFVLKIINGAKSNPDSSEDVEYLAAKANLGLEYAVVKGLGSVEDAISVMNDFGDQNTFNLAAARNTIERCYIDAVDFGSDYFLIQLVGLVADPFNGA